MDSIDILTDEILQNLELGECIKFEQWNITRVPGGWIWEHCLTQQMIFIPIPEEPINLTEHYGIDKGVG